MLDWIVLGIAIALGGGEERDQDTAGAGAEGGGAAGFVAEDQTPTGKFTTAAEIKQIVALTRPNWIAVREYNGQDWVYATQLLSWRCGMHEVRFSVNDGPMEVWELPECQLDTSTPNAFPEDSLPYRTYPPGHVQSIAVEVLFDDLDTDSASYARQDVLIP